VTLTALRGHPVVLVFNSLDFSPFCTTEMCAYRDDLSLFEGKGAQIFGISRDSTWTHKAFKAKEV
jgi:peroxiredoxin